MKVTRASTDRLILQFKLLIPLGAERVRLDGSRLDDLRRHRTHRVAVLTLALEAQPEAAVLAQLVVGRVEAQAVHAGVG